ncbi:SlyX family protein [Aestuariirhabdus sp. LZHN29]|uniref:SlyX family protein n=1 Tax=Aestuariirhabdus sp. LZHN29 TaxID=3417462 RepID=UPI003CE8B2B9
MSKQTSPLTPRDDAPESTRHQLVELQTQLAFQEDTIQALDRVVTRQQQQIDRLEEQLQYLRKRFEALPDTLGDEVPDQRPPHY